MAIDNYKVFEDYAMVVKKSLENILHDDNMAREDKVQIIYSTPPVAFAKFIQNTQNGQKPGPLVSFHLSGIAIEESQQLGGWATLMVNNEYRMRAPVVAKLKFEVTINAIKESQADLLNSQIILSMPFNRPYATMLNGQWVTLVASDFSNETESEISDGNDKTVKRTCEIEIDRAYFDHPIQVNSSVIKKINAHIYSVDKNVGVIDESN